VLRRSGWTVSTLTGHGRVEACIVGAAIIEIVHTR
jgi:hypothetical protein